MFKPLIPFNKHKQQRIVCHLFRIIQKKKIFQENVGFIYLLTRNVTIFIARTVFSNNMK